MGKDDSRPDALLKNVAFSQPAFSLLQALIGWGGSSMLVWMQQPLLPSTIATVSALEGTPLAAPADAAMGEATGTVKVRLQDAIESQQERLEEVYSGALDGLSGADIAPVVEELETLFKRLSRVVGDALPSLVQAFSKVLDGLAGPAGQQGERATAGELSQTAAFLSLSAASISPAGWIAERPFIRIPLPMAQHSDREARSGMLTDAGASAGRMDTATHRLERVGQASETMGGEHSAATYTAERAGLLYREDTSSDSMASMKDVGFSQAGFYVSDLALEADLGFSAAANNAVTAAVNVNTELNSIVMPLRSAVADVRRLADEIARLAAAISREAAAANGRREALVQSAEELKSALGAATVTASGLSSGLPKLILQLQDAVTALEAVPSQQSSGNNDRALREQVGKVAAKLDAAVSALRDAAESVEKDQSSLESAKENVEKLELSAEGAPTPAAVQEQQKAVSPALAAIEKAVGRLQAALAELEAAVGAAKDIDLPAAPH